MSMKGMKSSRKLDLNHEVVQRLIKELGFKKPEDWYRLQPKDLARYRPFKLLLAKHQNLPSKVLKLYYPDHVWLDWNFLEMLPESFWGIWENQKQFMGWLGIQLDFKRLEDWYRITQKDIQSRGGAILLRKFGNSPSRLVVSTWPDHPWILWSFDPKSSKDDPRKFLDRVGIQLGFKTMEDWYGIKSKDIRERGGSKYLDSFECSPSKMVVSTYSDHPWKLWKFRYMSRVWSLPSQREDMIDWLGKEFKVSSLEEWYRISWLQLHKHVHSNWFKKYPLEQALTEAYPNHKWDIPKLQSKRFGTMKASQRMLCKIVQEIFSNSEVIENCQHKEIVRGETGQKMQLDVYLPKERLGFEYQGEQHYMDIHALGSRWIQQERDREKKRACETHGITLIEVPYWWDFKKDSLVATIYQHAPHLIAQGEGSVIPKEPPDGFPTAALAELMHGEEWDGIQDLKDWWISEKLDGIRAFWNGSKLISKRGKAISCPSWFSADFPTGVKLDGELWMGRSTFEQTIAALSSYQSELWKEIKFMIFDLVVSDVLYENRMHRLKELKLPSFAAVLETRICIGNEDLVKQLNTIISAGGEGIVVTKPQSLYVSERTRTRLKVKFRVDIYACRKNNLECIVGCEPSTLNHPPKIGSVITVKHSGSYSNGRFRHAFYWRERPEVEWDDMSKENRKLVRLMIYSLFMLSQFFDADWRDSERRRKFFDDLMECLKFKSLEDFYRISVDQIAQHGGKALISHFFEGSLIAALQSVHPNHLWIHWKFEQKAPDFFWEENNNSRKFMDWLGTNLGFKHMHDWYQISAKTIQDMGGGTLLGKYGNSPPKLVIGTFPGHVWQLNRFTYAPKGLWKIEENKKELLDSLAIQLGVKKSEDWYRVTVRDIVKIGGGSLLSMYGGSPSKLVMSTYPNHRWDIFKFACAPKAFWDNPESRREYMEWLAVEMRFKHLEDWYKVTAKDIKLKKGATLLSRYESSPFLLLKAVYPDHQWLKWKFEGVWTRYKSLEHKWKRRKYIQENQREFMDWLYIQLGFKCMADWYSITVQHIRREKEGAILLDEWGSSARLVKYTYPDHLWQMENFEEKEVCNMQEQKNFMDRLGIKLGIKNMQDWYAITRKSIINEKNGAIFLDRYVNSPAKLVITTYPNHEWLSWHFEALPKGFWENYENRRHFMDWLGIQLGFQKMEDWYNIDANQFWKRGGGKLISKFDDSCELVQSIYSHHKWDPTKFRCRHLDLSIHLGEIESKPGLQR